MRIAASEQTTARDPTMSPVVGFSDWQRRREHVYSRETIYPAGSTQRRSDRRVAAADAKRRPERRLTYFRAGWHLIAVYERRHCDDDDNDDVDVLSAAASRMQCVSSPCWFESSINRNVIGSARTVHIDVTKEYI